MTAPAVAGMSRAEKQEMLRRMLAERMSRTRTVPTSFAQERLWVLDRMSEAGTAYNLPVMLRIPGPLDQPALERAVGELVRRHEALRTTFAEVDGAPVQIIAPFAGGLTLPVEELPGGDDAAVRRRGTEEAARPFDLAQGPLFRARLLRLGPDDHALLMCMHHIVSDGWSVGVMARELDSLYEAFREGKPSPLPEPTMQYADYAARQRERLRGPALERDLAYWRARLADAPALLELPTDRPRPPVQSYRGAVHRLEMRGALLERLEGLARAEGATLHMLLLGAFQTLLGKYAGSDDVVVGAPVAGRSRRELEDLVGFFVNTVVLRTDLSGDPPFRELLRRVRGVALGAYTHQEVPFERLVAELRPERSLRHTPLVQVMFTMDAANPVSDELPGMRGIPQDPETGTSKFDLTLSLEARPDEGLFGSIEYSTDLFDPATIERLGVRFRRLLDGIVRDSDARLSALALESEEERRRSVEAWNRTATAYPADAGIPELFEAQVMRTPDALAVVFGDISLTYAELNARANRLAHHLVRAGAGPEARVGICLERGAEMIVAMLAVLKAGGAYVPLEPRYPAERLAWMLADAGVAVLVTQDSLRGSVPVMDGVAVVSMDGDAARIAAESGANPASAAGPRSLAYVIYTSGSTGRPKGAGIEHRGIVRLVLGTDAPGVAPGERVAQASTPTFDAATWEVWGALLNGAVLAGISRDDVLSPERLEAALRENAIDHLLLTTPLFNAVARERPGAFSGLRTVRIGGEAADADALRRVLRAGAPGRLINVYGPTENTTFSTWHPVAEVPGDAATVPIGRPVANSTAYVLDGALRPVAAGLPGELCTGGDGVARGYLGRPALTAERFVPDPFSATPGARMYRTGDRARWKESAGVRECVSAEVDPGSEYSRTDALTHSRTDVTHSRTAVLEYLGRLDQQLKIRGFRIEPGEIEAVLRGFPGVEDCVVVARGDDGGRRLVAYLAGTADVDALRSELRRTLPDYMVPSAFVVLDRLPLAASGKVDRRALPEPELAAGAFVAPRTPTEEVLAGIWAEVLGVDRVSADAGFFALGGHSLLAARVMARVRAALGVEPTVRALFEASTLAALAAAVDEMRAAGGAEDRVGLVGRDRPIPLSFAQERLWVIDRLQPGLGVYNVPAALRLRGALDVPALERALGEIVRRHEVLRTTFGEHEGTPVQVIAPFTGFTLPVEDLVAMDEAARQAAVRARVHREGERPFDLAAGPLFRAALLRRDAEDHVLLVCMHHAVTDGWSLGVFFRELAALYGAFREGQPSPLPELPVQYAEHAVWERERLRGAVLEEHLAYWRERLAGAPALLELPTDHPRPAVQGTAGDSVSVTLPAELLQRLNAVGRGQGATLYMVLLGAFQVLLAKYSGSEDVVVGTPAAGRARPEVEGLIGFFVNTLVLRTDLSGDPAFREVLRRVREGALGAYDHLELPFERLVAELQPERSMGHAPLFQVLFALQNDDLSGGELPGLRTEPVGVEMDTAKFDLSLMFSEHAGGLWGEITYRTELFERGTIERMLGHLRRVLEQVSADPDLRLSGLQLLEEDERRQLVESWSGTDAPYPADACIHHLFQAQAARTPAAVAVVHEAESVTYAQLNARANRLAHHLRRLGVGPETRVGICLPRGVEMVAAMLGVLKAGGAYVPLDPTYPPERLAFMLADSGAAVVVTEDALPGLLPVGDGVRIVSIDRSAAEIARERSDDPDGGADPRGLAYLIYTSGSTGVPKGVAIEHGSAVAMLAWGAEVWTAEELDGVLASTSICFDISVYELFLPLSRGGRVILVENALALANSAAADQVRLINTVPSAIAALLRDDAIPASVRTVNLAGELLPQELVDAVYARPGIERVYDLYGPSEDTTYSTCALRRPGGIPSIGRTISNTHGYVVDAGLRLVPPGVAGELCLAGKGLARGYLGRPALTAERFVPDPFSATPGARMYRTGDRVRWKESAGVRECVSAEVGPGNADSRTDALTHSRTAVLQYLGRLDQQVKVRGFRIEPGEIEAVLRRHPGVADCAVVVRGDDAGERGLAAYVVGDAQPEPLRAHLRRSLPEYMVPGVFVRLDALPLTPSGKVDRKALPAPQAVSAMEQPAEARTPMEEVLAGIWAGVLKTERVGSDDNFFQLGGHSLLATVVVARVQEVLGVRLPLSALFTAPTVAALAAEVETLRRAGLPALPPVAEVDRGGALPLSFAQERLWFLDRLQPDSAFYNVPMALWLSGPLDVRALEHALGEIVRRHEVLRTVFRERDGAPSLSIAPFAGWTLPVDDLAGADEAEATRRAAAEASRPFDLGAGPLFRARLLRLSADEHVLLLTLHHTVSDEWSLGVLFREMSALYAAARDGVESPLPDLPVQYADYAVWQREQLRGETLDRQLAYWKRRLAGAPALLELPIDHPRPALQSYRGAREPFDLSAELLARLDALGRGEGATFFMVMLGALQVLLSKYSGSDDVVVGSPITGRTRHEVEGLIGFFTNTLVLRTDLSGDPGFRDVLRRVREATLGAYDHQDVPFERLVEELQPERSLGHSPLFQMMLIQGNGDDGALDLGGVAPRPFGTGTETAKFDLTLAVTAHAGGIAGSIEYNTDLFERPTVLRMIGHLRRVLEQVSADPDARLSRLELLGDEERRLVVEEWNGTDTPYPSAGACVHHLIEAQAERTPQAVAVEHGGESLTYRELNERANRLAHRLMALGVGPESRVGICLERGTAMVAAVLAVLKAGGAYVPMDPAYPAPRLAFMATDSAVPVLLTQESLRHVLPAMEGVHVLVAEAPVEEGPAWHAENPVSGAGPANLAFVLYTSGSTGTPKGVAMPHGALVNLMAWNLAAVPEPLRTLQFSSLSFDVSFQEMAVTLSSGGTVVLVDDSLRRDPDALLGFMARHRVERLLLPFVALHALAEAAAASAPPSGGGWTGGE
jgi:amino acid adenylation domain-containing protein